MFDFERFLEEKLNPVYRAHYALWVLWWPLWRKITGGQILRHWEQCNLVQEGHTFLDYGCGTGYFSLAAAKMVTDSGKVYALDYFPKQLEIVSEKCGKAGLTNIETIHSSSHTGLADESVDVVWLCDVLHEIKERRAVLKELHRVLKKDGMLALHDGMGEEAFDFTEGLFAPVMVDNKFLGFTKIS